MENVGWVFDEVVDVGLGILMVEMGEVLTAEIDLIFSIIRFTRHFKLSTIDTQLLINMAITR